MMSEEESSEKEESTVNESAQTEEPPTLTAFTSRSEEKDCEARNEVRPGLESSSESAASDKKGFTLSREDAPLLQPGDESDGTWTPKKTLKLHYLRKGAYGKIYLVMHLRSAEIAFARESKCNKQGSSKYLDEEILWREVSGHPYIVKLITIFYKVQNGCCFISEYLPMGDLRSFIQVHKVLQTHVVKILTAQIMSAINFMHNKGIFHRDVSNKNILIDKDGKVKLSNFKHAVANKTARGIHGHFFYQAPEVFEGKVYDMSADWFSLGACLYEMVMSLTPIEHHCLRHDINFGRLDYFGQIVVILASSIYIPNIFPKDLKSALGHLLLKDSKKRLGYKNDLGVFKEHPFFTNIDWERLEDGSLTVVLPNSDEEV